MNSISDIDYRLEEIEYLLRFEMDEDCIEELQIEMNLLLDRREAILDYSERIELR